MKTKIFSLLIISVFIFTSCGSDNKKDPGVYDVIVVGAGGGGLSAASQLARAGKKALLIEQHYRVGGYMTNFSRGDFRFEISLHAMENLNPGEMNTKMFKQLGIYDKLKPVKLDPLYSVIYPGLEMAIPADSKEYIKLLSEKFPEEKEGLEDFYATVKRIHTAIDITMRFSRGEYLDGFWEFIKQPWVFGTFMMNLDCTTQGFLEKFFKDELLIGVIAALGCFLGDEPDRISGIVFAIMWGGYHEGGYYHFIGGSQSITDALEAVYKENGGELLLSTRVTKILIEDGKAVGVKTKDGKTFKSRYVISNVNAPDTFFTLIGEEHLPEDYAKNLKEMTYTPGTFTLYIGTKKDFSKYFPGNSHSLNIYVSGNLAENYKPILTGDLDNVPFGIVNYTKFDKTTAPEGKNVLVCVTFMPYDWNNGWMENESPEAYKKFKEKAARMFLKRIEKYMPGLSSNIEVMEIATPRTNMHYTSNPLGSIMGWSNTVDQAMMNRLPQETPIDNLILSGAWTFPGSGQSAVLMSGASAAEIIIDMDD